MWRLLMVLGCLLLIGRLGVVSVFLICRSRCLIGRFGLSRLGLSWSRRMWCLMMLLFVGRRGFSCRWGVLTRSCRRVGRWWNDSAKLRSFGHCIVGLIGRLMFGLMRFGLWFNG